MRDRNELIRQIKAYKLDDKLQELARNSEQQRPFRHLPKQFSKGILIGNIAIVPRRADETRFVYVIADMIQAKTGQDSSTEYSRAKRRAVVCFSSPTSDFSRAARPRMVAAFSPRSAGVCRHDERPPGELHPRVSADERLIHHVRPESALVHLRKQTQSTCHWH